MKIPVLTIFLILLTGLFLFSMDWPTNQGRIIKNFGWNDEGIPHLGVSFASSGSIGASGDGELLYQRREGDFMSRLPSPLGSWTALDHGDGIISIYSRYESTGSTELPERLGRGRIFGESGISGWSSQNGLYFQLFDRKERRWINPFMIVTSPDTRLPLIHSVRLRNANAELLDPSTVGIISQGRYVILVDANDTRLNANDTPLAPYRIICILNGSEAGALNFETYSARDGSLMVNRNGLVPVRQVFAPVPAYEVAELWFSRGQTSLEIIAMDIAGNTRNVVYRFIVE